MNSSDVDILKILFWINKKGVVKIGGSNKQAKVYSKINTDSSIFDFKHILQLLWDYL